MQRIREVLAIVVATIVSMAMLGTPLLAAPTSQLGTVVFADHAHVGLAAASVGSTVFGGDRLSVEPEGSVQIRSGAARFLLASGGTATLSSDDATPSATLTAGTATFSTANARAFTLHFANAAIRANTDQPTVGQVSVLGPKELVVKSTRGSLAFTVAGQTRVVAEGSAYHVILDPTASEAAAAFSRANRETPPQGGEPRAGEISRVIPNVGIVRGGQTLTGSANSEVDWQDQISTLANARARVGLDDGSVLNVGSDSLMRVLKHDAGAQQTELELTYGKLRSRAQKIVKADGKFEVRTAAGIAGVVGTDFYVGYDSSVMNVLVFEGVVRVCNLAGVCVLVKAGEMTMVRANDNSPPAAPLPIPFDLMSSAAADTDDGGESVAAATSSSQRADRHSNKGSSGPISAGSSKFVWYAVGITAVVTAVAIHQAYESPDRP